MRRSVRPQPRVFPSPRSTEMTRTRTTLAALTITLLGLCRSVPAQTPFTLAFSTDGKEVAASGAGGSVLFPGNPGAIFGNESVMVVSPSATTPFTAYGCATKATWAAYFGDDDGDGLYTEGVVGRIDAIQFVPGTQNPPTIFDFYLSFSHDHGGQGRVVSPIDDGDVVRLRPAGGVTYFITRVQIASAMATPGLDIDVDGICVASNGDIYWSMTLPQTVNGVTVEDGGVVRLPAAAYVANPDGTVAFVTPGAAQIVLREADVNVYFANAGIGVVGDLDGLEIDPAGGTVVVAGTGFTIPNLWLSGDGSSTAVICSTRTGGSIASRNGVILSGGPALGLGPTNFDGGAVHTVTGIAVRAGSLSTAPRLLNIHDTELVTPGSLVLGVGGASPNGSVLLMANLAQVTALGGYTPRTVVVPYVPAVSVPGGFPELYTDDFVDPLWGLITALPPVPVSSQGYAQFTFAVPTLPPGFGVAFQALDLPAFALTTCAIPVTQ